MLSQIMRLCGTDPFRAPLLILLLWVAGVAPAWGHDPGLSIATGRLASGKLSIHLAMARVDLERLVNLDANPGGQVTEAKPATCLQRLQSLGQEAFVVTCAGRSISLVSVEAQRDNQDGIHFRLTFSEASQGDVTISSGLLNELPRGHRQFLSVRDEKGNLLSEQMLDATHNTVRMNCAPQLAGKVAQHSVREFLALGVMHIATAYDHLLFLLGLLLVGGSLRSALQIITSFTCAHSITLALATLNLIQIPARVVEPLIAASIIYVGMENLLRPDVKGRWRLTFAFGLIHGCGFATALRELGIGTNGVPIAIPLLSFNVGVEAGQMTIAALVLPMIWKFHSSPALMKRLVPIGSALIAMAGCFWLLQRTLF